MEPPSPSPTTTPPRSRSMGLSPFRHKHASSASPDSLPRRTASTSDRDTIRHRPRLRRPSASAPGLATQNDKVPPSGVISPPLSPQPESPAIHQVLETHHIQRHHNSATGNPTINNYEILGDIGAGVHGKVKKAKHSETGQIVAIKIINRVTKKRLGNYDPNEQENKIRREIAIMKKCHHPNIVNLIEVIDNFNSQKVYLVLEYVERGEIKWRDKNNRPILTVDEIRPMIRDVVLGLEYLHFQGIIHRDIKPGNLLISNNGTVKISDFGVSHLAKMDEHGNLLPENDLDLAKTAGSPAFFAPELCYVDLDKLRPVITKAIDVWALGITFYCLLFGREPFPGVHGEMELYEKICNVAIEVPVEYENNIDSDTKDLLYRLVTQDPKERIRLHQVRRHPFITKDLPDPKKWAEETDLAETSQPLEVTPQELESAVTSFRNIVRRTFAQVKMTAKRSMSYLRPKNTSGRMLSGVSSPVSGVASPVLAATLPNSPTRSFLNAGVRESLSTEGRNSESMVRPKNDAGIHAYFHFGSSAVRSPNAPPTPPHSGRVGTVVPNGHDSVSGHVEEPDVAVVMPPISRPEHHLADDYSNLYYSDDDDLDLEHDSDDERLEMKFGSRKEGTSMNAYE